MKRDVCTVMYNVGMAATAASAYNLWISDSRLHYGAVHAAKALEENYMWKMKASEILGKWEHI